MNEAESKVFLIQPYFLSPSVLGVLMKSKEDILFLLLGQPHMTFGTGLTYCGSQLVMTY
jgi:hypothetical protein